MLFGLGLESDSQECTEESYENTSLVSACLFPFVESNNLKNAEWIFVKLYTG